MCTTLIFFYFSTFKKYISQKLVRLETCRRQRKPSSGTLQWKIKDQNYLVVSLETKYSLCLQILVIIDFFSYVCPFVLLFFFQIIIFYNLFYH
jgi:hypothetical protein